MMEEFISVIASQPPLHILTFITLLSPAAGSLLLVLLSISGIEPPERWVAWVSGITVSGAAISAVRMAWTMSIDGRASAIRKPPPAKTSS